MPWPTGFSWGISSCATHSEGAAPASDWARQEHAGTVPPSGDGNGFAVSHADDFALAAGAGLTNWRLTLEWARLEPSPGQHDGAAIDRYRQMLETARDVGVTPWACLHHYALPGWFADDEGGFWRDRRQARYRWATHVDFVAETFGDLVGGWIPIHAPSSYTFGHAPRFLPTTVRTGGRLMAMLETVNLCATDAARLVRGAGAPVATDHALAVVVRDDESEAAGTATQGVDDRIWASWNSSELLEPFDLLGCSHPTSLRVHADGSTTGHPAGVPHDQTGATPWSEGLSHVLRRAAEVQPLPLLALDVGLATSDEAWRAHEIGASTQAIAEAIGDGVDVRGCFFRTAIDGYEWQHGFDATFGLFNRDRQPREAFAVLQSTMG